MGRVTMYLSGGVSSDSILTSPPLSGGFQGPISSPKGGLLAELRFDRELDFQALPICEGRTKITMVPDVTLLSQVENFEEEIFMKTGFITGRQALTVPRRTSRLVNRATKW